MYIHHRFNFYSTQIKVTVSFLTFVSTISCSIYTRRRQFINPKSLAFHNCDRHSLIATRVLFGEANTSLAMFTRRQTIRVRCLEDPRVLGAARWRPTLSRPLLRRRLQGRRDRSNRPPPGGRPPPTPPRLGPGLSSTPPLPEESIGFTDLRGVG